MPQGLSDKRGRTWDGDFGEVSSQRLVGAELIIGHISVWQQGARGKQHVARSGEPDRHADGAEAEEIQGPIAQLLADVTGQQIHGAAQQGQGAAQQCGE